MYNGYLDDPAYRFFNGCNSFIFRLYHDHPSSYWPMLTCAHLLVLIRQSPAPADISLQKWVKQTATKHFLRDHPSIGNS